MKTADFLGICPQECYVVEDARAGIDAAKAAACANSSQEDRAAGCRQRANREAGQDRGRNPLTGIADSH